MGSKLHADPEDYLNYKHKDGVTEAAPKYNPIQHSDKLPVVVRVADKNDVSFIYSSWLKSYASQNKDQPRITIYKMHRPIVTRLLEEAVTLVACMEDDSSQILAWICGERISKFLVVHYVYTKEAFRRFHLARSLLDAFDFRKGEPMAVSHKGYIVKDLKGRYNMQYIPHLQQPGGMKHLKEIYKCES